MALYYDDQDLGDIDGIAEDNYNFNGVQNTIEDHLMTVVEVSNTTLAFLTRGMVDQVRYVYYGTSYPRPGFSQINMYKLNALCNRSKRREKMERIQKWAKAVERE